MAYRLFDYHDAQGRNEFKAWSSGLQKVQLGKLNARLDMLADHGEELFPHILTNSSVATILKLRCKGQVQLRPLLCRGPINAADEFTLLAGATERGSVLEPQGVADTALARKNAVRADPQNRRKDHERVS